MGKSIDDLRLKCDLTIGILRLFPTFMLPLVALMVPTV